MNLTDTFRRNSIYQFPFDSHHLHFTLQIRTGAFRHASLRPARLDDNATR